jgi:hypothetical protein
MEIGSKVKFKVVDLNMLETFYSSFKLDQVVASKFLWLSSNLFCYFLDYIIKCQIFII